MCRELADVQTNTREVAVALKVVVVRSFLSTCILQYAHVWVIPIQTYGMSDLFGIKFYPMGI